uniref:NADH-ubiquinone oxidoreductase chain 6 n=1 Tax=Gelasimus borealis TaxID=626958 RepID=A0A344GDH8_9EUCA|nr:NADH dehydrogenase subunit 6 [Gelasimus borealis]AXA13748.1 NADH dehydrogenase subunit 6 [Gelasimus borealis]AZZ73253.1 NADH dehydrogenase subunit 6 [Gelasimus borealis]
MLLLTLPLLLSFSILFTQLSHPLAMGLILLIQTLLISITLGLSSFSFWFSYILFLIFLGGMLVLFIYVASIASNETFIPSMSYFFVVAASLILSLSLLVLDPFLTSSSSSLPWSSFFVSASVPSTISWIYNSPSMSFTIFVICYLLLMLIIVVKIVNLFKGPLRLTQK